MTKLQQLIPKTLAIVAFIAIFTNIITTKRVSALESSSCKDVIFIFARGSKAGEIESNDKEVWRQSFENLPELKSLDISFYNLGDGVYDGASYPAAEIGFSSLKSITTTLSAINPDKSAGTFNKSVNEGARELVGYIKSVSAVCEKTKFVLGGYSQGAMVLHRAFDEIDSSKIIYAATFGDPNLYLPEGEGMNPPACRNELFSDYRIFAPNCRTHSGILGASKPYMPESFKDKVGLWCNAKDIMCSNYIDVYDFIGDHIAYTTNGIYAQAAQFILQKIAKAIPEKLSETAEIKPLHARDTAFLIDTTGSMSSSIKKYREEAIKTAEQTVKNGGRIALFEYRDLSADGRTYVPHELCDFSCTIEEFTDKINNLKPNGGGDAPESVLSASFGAMQKLVWQKGATKSIVVLTDSPFHDPDLDDITKDQVIKKSLEIDPVVFYVITNSENKEYYEELTNLTGGRVFDIDTDEIKLSTTILTKPDDLSYVFDPLLNVAEPKITNVDIQTNQKDANVKFSKINSSSTLVFLNNYLLGQTTEDEIIIKDLSDGDYTISLSPISSQGQRGETVTKSFKIGEEETSKEAEPNLSEAEPNLSKAKTNPNNQNTIKIVNNTAKKNIPLAPNAGICGF